MSEGGNDVAKMVTETSFQVEPFVLSTIPPTLSDVAAEVSVTATELSSSLAPQTLESAANLTRIMNCYYSNLIEGHRTRPRVIEKILDAGDEAENLYAIHNASEETLLRLAMAHISVQEWIDDLHHNGSLPDPSSVDFICAVHEKFYEKLSHVFLEIKCPSTGDIKRTMKPGIMRKDGEEVSVGHHHPPAGGGAVQNFMQAYHRHYQRGKLDKIGRVQRLCAIAAAHHRFSYIHPFDDGNGRVARLLTHAMMLDAGFGAKGFWSMSRGLARGLIKEAPHYPKFLKMYDGALPTQQYKLMMAHADQKRMGSLDGRGNLSEQRLQEFCEWFLAIALDQIKFMGKHLNKETLIKNIAKHYIPLQRLDPKLEKVITEIVRLGEIQRSSVRTIMNVSARTATNIISDLLKDGIVKSNGNKDPLYLNFSIKSAEILIPGLFSVEALSDNT